MTWWPWPRRIGPKPPGLVPRVWRALLLAAPPVFWAQLGAGMILTAYAMTTTGIIAFGSWPGPSERMRIDALLWITMAVLFLVLVALVAIAGLRLALKASKDGFNAGVERDDDEPHTVAIEGQVTVTPKDPAP